MSATTPKYGLPYPLDTDQVRELPEILTTQAQRIETLLSGFDFNGQDTDGLAARVTATENTLTTTSTRIVELTGTVGKLQATVEDINMILDTLGTVRVGAFTYDATKMNVSSNRLLRIRNMVFATCLYSFKSGVVSGANAHVATVLNIPDGFTAALKTRVSVTHNQIAPGVDDSAVEGNRLSQWNINDSTSSFSLTGIWVTTDD